MEQRRTRKLGDILVSNIKKRLKITSFCFWHRICRSFFISLNIMIRKILFTVALFIASFSFSQQETPVFKDGEWLRFKMSYSGFLKAGEAEISLKEKFFNGKKVFHATGKGKTTSVISWFFKVRDRYESFFDVKKGTPYKFIRDVNEGGHKIRRDIAFKNSKAYIKDFISKEDTVKKAVNVHDMISTFYYLRSYDTSKMKKGDEIAINMFFDSSTYPFKMRYLGTEMLNTKFGKVKTQIFRPIVKAGRVFKEQESVTVWVTADANKIPIYIKASLAVGSLRASLDAYKGLANPFEIVFD